MVPNPGFHDHSPERMKHFIEVNDSLGPKDVEVYGKEEGDEDKEGDKVKKIATKHSNVKGASKTKQLFFFFHSIGGVFFQTLLNIE